MTSFFLLVTALGISLDVGFTGLNFERSRYLASVWSHVWTDHSPVPEQIWRPFSAIFVHIGWEHFIVNMISLYLLGRQVEEIFGSKQFFFLYLIRNDGHPLCLPSHRKSQQLEHPLLSGYLYGLSSQLRNSQPLYSAVGAILSDTFS